MATPFSQQVRIVFLGPVLAVPLLPLKAAFTTIHCSDGRYAYGLSDTERPFRWYDASIPYEFPEVVDDVSRTGGELRRKPKVRGGYFFNAIGEWKRGRLSWLHSQEGNTASFYAIYFDLLPRGARPSRVSPRGWIGDGLPRCDRRGSSTIGADHCRIDVDDWNGDGLVDIIAGEQYGHVFVWPNRGTKDKPAFPYCRFVFDVEGLPIDAGSASAPKIVDWNGDGAKDLLIGAEWNRILLFLNQGTNADRRLKYVGLLEADGKVLTLPIKPLQRGSEQIFKRDYYPGAGDGGLGSRRRHRPAGRRIRYRSRVLLRESGS